MTDNNKNYVTYHLHDETSLLDSCTNYKLYVDKAKELGQKAICFTNHGYTFNWVEKKMYCDKNGIKYLHGVEIYLTRVHDKENKVRDNYHSILIAKNYEGVKEINKLIDISTQPDHFYYKPRLSFDEFLNISDNVITISACIKSPLAQISDEDEYFDLLAQKYDYYEIQPHNFFENQKKYNEYLYNLSKKYNKKLIAGTDTHSLNSYKAQCRHILQKAKRIEFDAEDELDLTYKSYEELVELFKQQRCLPEMVYLKAIENTNAMADMVEDFELDLSFKYPKLYVDEEEVFIDVIKTKYNEKLKKGIISDSHKYLENINEELRVFKKLNMIGFMLFMSELCTWCRENDIPTGVGRGSVGGSTIAYITDITDCDPVKWNTIFSRFCNEDRLEIGDIDIDFAPSDRQKVYDYIIERFGEDYTSYVLAIGTIVEKATIDEIGRALDYINKDNIKKAENELKTCSEEEKIKIQKKLEEYRAKDYSISKISAIKKEFEANPEETKKSYPDIFYYFDGLVNTAVSQSMHPAGIIISPVTLPDNYGTFWKDGKRIISINMDEIHEISLVKYDILGLKNVEVIKDTCKMVGIPYPLSHNINWEDKDVWDDMITSPIGIFQFEGDYSFELLARYKPQKINDMNLVNASLRPSGASYRDNLIAKKPNKNPSEVINKLLAQNLGYLVFQEDTLKFLQDICGFSGSEADNVRRAIGRKQRDRVEKALPKILEGYCSKSDKPREIAEEEAKTFLKIIEDSSEYQFGYNHSTQYSMIGYLCAMLRYYYPLEFITAYLNNAKNESDITSGIEFAKSKNINIKPIKFRYSGAGYSVDKETNSIYQGLSTIKFLGISIAEELLTYKNKQYNNFIELLIDLDDSTLDTRQTKILIALEFFSEFGKSKKLMNLFDYFQKIYNKKTFKKDSLPCDEEIIKQYSKETNKTYKEIDSLAILYEIEKTIPDEDLSIGDRLRYEFDYLGYSQLVIPNIEKWDVGFVLDVNTKTTPKVKVYMLNTGEELTFKIYKKVFNKHPLDKYDFVYLNDYIKKKKPVPVERDEEGKVTKWGEGDEVELVLTNYTDVNIKKFEKWVNNRSA